MSATKAIAPVPAREVLLAERVERRIYLVRGQKVMLDRDLADLYGVSTGRLNEQVRRNIARFPLDFMFRLTTKEAADLRFDSATSREAGNLRSQIAISSLRSQSVTSNRAHGGRRYAPLAFTEQGVAMLSSVLRSERAVQVNIAIMRAFVRLRELLATHKGLARKLEELERKYDKRFRVVFVAIRQLMSTAEPPRRRVGF